MDAREIEVVRGEGCGNAYLFVDGTAIGTEVAHRVESCGSTETPRWLTESGDRTLDGVILLAPDDDGAERRAIVWNADGSRGEVCGNGLRAAALLLRERFGIERGSLRSDSGLHAFSFEKDGRVAVDLPPPAFTPTVIGLVPEACARFEATGGPPLVELRLPDGTQASGHALSMGNPHLVLPQRAAVVGELSQGPQLERHAAFPARVNVSYAWPIEHGRVGQRTFERGSGETAACGSGACATAVVARYLGWCDDRATLVQPGGELEVRMRPEAIALVGPARLSSAAPLRLEESER